jgi:hypothetical protein
MLRSPIQGEPLRWWEVVRKSLLLGRPGGPGSRFRAFPTPGRSVGRVQTLGPTTARGGGASLRAREIGVRRVPLRTGVLMSQEGRSQVPLLSRLFCDKGTPLNG